MSTSDRPKLKIVTSKWRNEKGRILEFDNTETLVSAIPPDYSHIGNRTIELDPVTFDEITISKRKLMECYERTPPIAEPEDFWKEIVK